MKDVDHFQTIEIRATLTITDIKHLYLLLARAEYQDKWSVDIPDFRNKRLLTEFSNALHMIPEMITTEVKTECKDAIYQGDLIRGVDPEEEE